MLFPLNLRDQRNMLHNTHRPHPAGPTVSVIKRIRILGAHSCQAGHPCPKSKSRTDSISSHGKRSARRRRREGGGGHAGPVPAKAQSSRLHLQFLHESIYCPCCLLFCFACLYCHIRAAVWEAKAGTFFRCCCHRPILCSSFAARARHLDVNGLLRRIHSWLS